MDQEKPYRVHKNALLVIALSIAATLTALMFYRQYQLENIDVDHYYGTFLQNGFNEEFDYTAIDGDAEKLREIISKTHIELHGEIENVKLHKLRDRMFDLIWTHHIGGFSNYMKLRKPAGIEYHLSDFGFEKAENDFENMKRLVDWMREKIPSFVFSNFTNNFISEVCVDFAQLNELQYYTRNMNDAGQTPPYPTNILFGVHVFHTNSLADPRFCGDVLDFTSTNEVAQFDLMGNTVFITGYTTPFGIYTTPETPRQELEMTGEITIAYAYFAFKCIHHKNNAAPFIAQWHWDKKLNRWITDYYVSGNDYRHPNTRYYTEPWVTPIF